MLTNDVNITSVINVTTQPGQTITEENSADIEALLDVINGKIPDAIDAGGGQMVIPVGVIAGDVSATISGTPNVNVSNFPADPASGTNQVTTNGKLDTLITHTSNTATNTSSINGKLPSLTTNPTTTTSAIPVRQAPSLVPGKQLHVQTTAGITNGANKMLLGFNNDTGLSCCVTRVHAVNTQSTPISGVFTWIYVRRGTGLITGGSQVTGVTSPALVTSMRDPSFSVPVGFTFWTNGTLGGTISTLESARWTTEEVSPNGSGLSEMIMAQGNYSDLWDFTDDPIVIPDQYSLAVICDSTMTNGQTLIDFNICFAQ